MCCITTVVVDRLVLGQHPTRGRGRWPRTIADCTRVRATTGMACSRLGPEARTCGKVPSQSVPTSGPGHGAMPTPECFSLLNLQSYIEFTWARHKIRENYYHSHCISIYLRLFSQQRRGYFKRVMRLSSKSWYSCSLRDTSRRTHLKFLKMFEFEKTLIY